MPFSNIIGHQQTKAHLLRLVNNKQLPHALLLTGPSQIGKATIQIALAQYLQDDKNNLIPQGSHPATHLNIESNSCKIEEIRQINEQAHLRTEFPYHLFLIKNIERLTTEASNALLKLLEEPPEQVKFLLTSSQPSQLLPTIISRCQVHQLNNLSLPELRNFAQIKFPTHQINDLQFLLSLGKPGRLHDLLTNKDYFDQLQTWYKTIQATDDFELNHSHFLLAKDLAQADRNLVIDFLHVYQAYLRQQGHSQIAPKHWASKQIIVEQTIQNIAANHNIQLCLENMFIGEPAR